MSPEGGGWQAVRPFKVIALLCAFLGLALDVAALLSPAWVTSDRYSLSLWEGCRQVPHLWRCLSSLQTGEQGPQGLTLEEAGRGDQGREAGCSWRTQSWSHFPASKPHGLDWDLLLSRHNWGGTQARLSWE